MNKFTIMDAIKALDSNASCTVRDGVIEWKRNTLNLTDSQIQTKLAELQAGFPLEELRETRTRLLAETDWMANKDVTLPAAWETYRQELRDLPTGLDTVEKVNAVTWPTKPE